jgi:hypothetical protein
MDYRTRILALGLAVAAIVAAGCGSGGPTGGPVGASGGAMAGGAGAAGQMDFLGNMPGLPVTQLDDPSLFKSEATQVASRYGGSRNDPFALRGDEVAYDRDQESARLVASMGSFTGLYALEPERDPDADLVTEPQPYRRLSGIVVGESVYAIIDMGDGSPATIIRPGMRIPNSEWTVASIDEEKAVLTRTGNRLPRSVVVRLESPPPGMGGAQGSPSGFPGPGGGPPLGGREGPGGGAQRGADN